MPIALTPIQPSARPPVYCTECGCEVDSAAWLCATCGKNLHEPDSMTPTRPFAPAASKNPKATETISDKIFGWVVGIACVIFALVIVRYLFADELIKNDRGRRYLLHILPSGLGGHPQVLRWVVLGVGVPLLLWFCGVFKHRQRG